MGGVRTRFRGKVTSFVGDSDTTNPKTRIPNSGKTIDDTQAFSQSVQLSPTNQLFPSNGEAITSPAAKKVTGFSVFLGKTMNLIDKLGSSMADWHLSSDFNSGAAPKGDKISILAFDVAKTIRKGHMLMQSLSDESIQRLKTTVVSSRGPSKLISEDAEEVLRIAASDQRDELESFVREVARFGKRCKDPQWRDLERHFERLASDRTLLKRFCVDSAMVEMMTLVDHTVELLSAMGTLDQIEREHTLSLQDENALTSVQKGDFAILTDEMNTQRKLVKTLKKKSLWSKSFEEVVKKLELVIRVLLFKMNEAFGSADGYRRGNGYASNSKRLGESGMALHYADIITRIDILGSLSNSAPPSMKDDLYQRLPHWVKSSLREKLQSFPPDLECTHIKAEMEKSLQWLGPIARNTTKALQGFGWTGGWAYLTSDVNPESSDHTEALRIETLYHADKERTEAHILELVVWLHHLMIRSRNSTPSGGPSNHRSSMLSFKQEEIPDNVGENISKYGISRSQNFAASKIGISKIHRLAKSGRESRTSRKAKKDPLVGWPFNDLVIDFDINRKKILDIIDGLEIT